MRVTVVTNVPAPYRQPLFSLLDARLRERDGSLAVIYAANSAEGMQWAGDEPVAAEPDTTFLNRRPLRVRGRNTYVNPLVALALRRTRPDVAILGGYAPWMYAALLWCLQSGTPYLIWSGVTLRSAQEYGFHRMRRAPLIRGAAGFLAYGPAASDYLVSIGVDRSAIAVVGNGIDIDTFAARADAARLEPHVFRHSSGVGSGVVLSVGGKGLDLARAAIARLDRSVQLVVAGTKEVRDVEGELWLGRLRPSCMPAVFAAGDCLVHTPQLDYWPHAINEALASGTPVVATRDTGVPNEVYCGPGCASVEHDAEQVAEALAIALDVASTSSPELREAIRQPLRPWGVDWMVQRIVAAAECALQGNDVVPANLGEI